jgi:hypothetical protein
MITSSEGRAVRTLEGRRGLIIRKTLAACRTRVSGRFRGVNFLSPSRLLTANQRIGRAPAAGIRFAFALILVEEALAPP